MKQTRIRVPARVLFEFHARPDAFALLMPPWMPMTVVTPPRSLEVGTLVELRAPLVGRMVFEHVAYDPPRRFTDRQVIGPFRTWTHDHVVLPDGDDASILSDEVLYESRIPWMRFQLARLFAYRHRVTQRTLEG